MHAACHPYQVIIDAGVRGIWYLLRIAMKKIKLIHILLAILACAVATIPFRFEIRNWLRGGRTVAQRLEEFGPVVRTRLIPRFDSAGVAYPPDKLVLVGLKEERCLDVWGASAGQKPRFLYRYAVTAASGKTGPKLREGDRQVPEGLYKIESLNPNSAYHLSLRVNYPNEFDRDKGRQDGRNNLGGDIMIHGSNVSIGCLAMGNEVAEDLFVLAADTGLDNIAVILSPVDFRRKELPETIEELPDWMPELYEIIKAELSLLI